MNSSSSIPAPAIVRSALGKKILKYILEHGDEECRLAYKNPASKMAGYYDILKNLAGPETTQEQVESVLWTLVRWKWLDEGSSLGDRQQKFFLTQAGMNLLNDSNAADLK